MNSIKTASLILMLFTFLSTLISCEVKYSEDAIEQALSRDDANKTKRLLAKVNADTLKFAEGRNLLQLALLRGATKVTKFVMENYKLQDSIDDYGYTALHLAILEDYNEDATMLINSGCNLSIMDGEGYSPLHYATMKSNEDLVKHMIAEGADINLKTALMNSTPLHIAIEHGNSELTKFFRSKDATDTIMDTNEQTAQMLALESINPEIINLYFDDFTEDDKNVLLYNTIRNDSITINIEKWIDEKWVAKNTLQEAFVFVKYSKVATLLLQKGVDINRVSNAFGYGAVHHSAIRGDVKMLEFLLKNGADVNKVSVTDMSPLMQAAMLYDDVLIKQDVGGVEFTLSQSYLDNFGMSYDKNVENSLASVKFLLEHKANLNFTNIDKENALYIAAASFNIEVVDYLKEQGITETKRFVESQAERNSRVLDKIRTNDMLKNMNYNY